MWLFPNPKIKLETSIYKLQCSGVFTVGTPLQFWATRTHIFEASLRLAGATDFPTASVPRSSFPASGPSWEEIKASSVACESNRAVGVWFPLPNFLVMAKGDEPFFFPRLFWVRGPLKGPKGLVGFSLVPLWSRLASPFLASHVSRVLEERPN